MKIMQIASHAIDWFSVRTTGVVSSSCIFLGIKVNSAHLVWAGFFSALSTIIYNGVRTYKELKNKN